VDRRASLIDAALEPTPGVNVVGFLHGELGLGEIARKLVRALHDTDVPVAAIPYDGTPSRQEHDLGFETTSRAPYDTNIVCLNANELSDFVAQAGVGFFSRRYSVGVWFWETSVFRAEDGAAFRFLDEVWAPSRYVRNALEQLADIPVLVAPIPIEAPATPTFSREDLGLPNGFVFLFLFDFVSAERKNPLAVVRAFEKAFSVGEGPKLVLKSINGRERKPRQLAQLEAAIGGRQDIVLLDGYVSAGKRDAIVAACDCFVSLHRSEGLGLTMAEAMSLAKPVIATGYSGNLEFMTDENSHLVPYRLTPVPSDWWAYAPGAEWAEPDVDAAARLMRRVWEHPDEARALGARARDDVIERHSPTRTAEFVSDRVLSGHARDLIRMRARHDPRAAILEATREHAAGIGAGLVDHGANSGLVALMRRLLARALWPHLKRQHRLDAEVLDALQSLERAVREVAAARPRDPQSPPKQRPHAK
jgi:glycosyltransferase involved in cell wall biosynthesis